MGAFFISLLDPEAQGSLFSLAVLRVLRNRRATEERGLRHTILKPGNAAGPKGGSGAASDAAALVPPPRQPFPLPVLTYTVRLNRVARCTFPIPTRYAP